MFSSILYWSKTLEFFAWQNQNANGSIHLCIYLCVVFVVDVVVVVVVAAAASAVCCCGCRCFCYNNVFCFFGFFSSYLMIQWLGDVHYNLRFMVPRGPEAISLICPGSSLWILWVVCENILIAISVTFVCG